MAKSAFVKDILRSIKNTKSRFLAIFGIVALGAGFFSGLSATSYDMEITGDKYYDDGNMMDIRLVSTYGFTQDDIDCIRKTEGVSAVMEGYSIDAMSDIGGTDTVVRIHSLPPDAADNNPDYLNRPVLTEGRLPQRPGECVLSEAIVRRDSLKLGDTVTLKDTDGTLADSLATSKFKIVGFANSAYYIALTYGTSSIGSGTIGRFMYISREDFTSDVFTDVYASVDGAAELGCFSDEYVSLVDKTKDRLETLSDTREPLRFDEVKKQAQDELDDAREEYEEEKEKVEVSLADALAQLDDAEKEINDAQKKLDEGKIKLNMGWNTYRDGMEKYNEGLAEFKENQATYSTMKSQYDAAKAQLDEGYAQYDRLIEAGTPVDSLSGMKAELDSNAATLSAQKAQLDAFGAGLSRAESQLNASKKQLDDAHAELIANQKKLDDSYAELDDAKKELEDGRNEYNDAKAKADEKLGEALDELDEAQKDIDELDMTEWYVLDRDTNVGFVSFKGDTQRMASLSTVFPVLFFLVAALVALTTMTRMVDEERMIIGTYKSLGYGSGRIMMKYLLYAFIASVAGSLLGAFILMKVLPAVVWDAYRILYEAPPIIMPYKPSLMILGAAAATGCTLLSTYFACRSALKEQPSELLRPRAPKIGKRIFLEKIGFIWKRVQFSWKVTFRNIFRYKKRLYMTLAGIAGCTALLLTGFGVKDSVSDIVRCQFDEIYQYNTQLTVADGEITKDAKKLLDNKDYFDGWMPLNQKAADISTNDNNVSGYVFIPDNARQMTDFIALTRARSGKKIAFDENSVILTEKASNLLGVGKGDTVKVEVESGRYCDFKITDVAENYVYHYLYISPQVWKSTTELDSKPTEIIAKCTAADRDALSKKLIDCDGIGTAQFTDETSEKFNDMIESLNYVVMVLIVSAGALAFIVLYNLTNINITERKRELATIKVLGFYDNEVSSYIYRETALLSVMGCIIGLGLGVIMHRFVVKTVEVDAVMFGRTISTMSFVWSSALTLFFSFIVNLVMHKSLKKINMVESLKSAE